VAAEEPQEGSVIEEKLDAVVNLLQDLFILEATRGGMGQEPIRKILGVRMTRVSDIRKHID
jgi:hypothetical protein